MDRTDKDMLEELSSEIKFLEIDSKIIEYQVFGDISNDIPVLILLHEGLGSIAMWRKIPELIHLKTKLNVFVYSRFGYGKSSTIKLPRPTNYMSIEAEEYLPKIIKSYNATYHRTNNRAPNQVKTSNGPYIWLDAYDSVSKNVNPKPKLTKAIHFKFKVGDSVRISLFFRHLCLVF